MNSKWIAVARHLVRASDRQWLEAALAEVPHIDAQHRADWRAETRRYVWQSFLLRVAVATAAVGLLALTALGIGWLDLHIEPTSVSLALILAASATGGYILTRSWWLPGLMIGSSISLTAWTVHTLGLHPSGRPVTTSSTSMVVLLALTIPAIIASRTGAALRRRLLMRPTRSEKRNTP